MTFDPTEGTARAVAAGVELSDDLTQRIAAVKRHFVERLDTGLTLEEIDRLFAAHPEWKSG